MSDPWKDPEGYRRDMDQAEIESLRRQRDAAVADVARLREALEDILGLLTAVQRERAEDLGTLTGRFVASAREVLEETTP